MKELPIEKLYNFTFKLINLLEEEIDNVNNFPLTGIQEAKKNITATLNKLVNLIIQINKLDKEQPNKNKAIAEKDKEIIVRFIEKYNK